MPRHLLVGVDAPGCLPLTDGARVAAVLVRSVRLAEAPEIPPLHDALEAAAFGDSGDVHELALAEQADRNRLPDGEGPGLIGGDAELLEHPAGLDPGLLEATELGPGEPLLLGLPEAEGHRGVAVALRGPLAHHGAGGRIDDGDRDEVAVLVEHLGHPNLLTDQALHVLSSHSQCGAARGKRRKIPAKPPRSRPEEPAEGCIHRLGILQIRESLPGECPSGSAVGTELHQDGDDLEVQPQYPAGRKRVDVDLGEPPVPERGPIAFPGEGRLQRPAGLAPGGPEDDQKPLALSRRFAGRLGELGVESRRIDLNAPNDRLGRARRRLTALRCALGQWLRQRRWWSRRVRSEAGDEQGGAEHRLALITPPSPSCPSEGTTAVEMTAPAQHGQRETEQRKAEEEMDPLPDRAAGHIAHCPQHQQDASHRPEHARGPFRMARR